jgi:hypothetical protein
MNYPEFHHLGFKIVITYFLYHSISLQYQNATIKAKQLEQLGKLNENISDLRRLEEVKINMRNRGLK